MQLNGFGKGGTGSQRYAFYCRLDKFEGNNPFCKELAPLVSDANIFCTRLCEMAKGAVKFESACYEGTSHGVHDEESSSQKRKRSGSHDEHNPSKRRATKPHEVREHLQEEIGKHQIGILDYACMHETKLAAVVIASSSLEVSGLLTLAIVVANHSSLTSLQEIMQQNKFGMGLRVVI